MSEEAIAEELNSVAKTIIETSRKLDLESTLTVALLCGKANNKYTKDRKRQLTALLPFSAVKFSYFAKIGSASYLYEEEARPHLPSSFSILYQLSKAGELAFKDGCEKGIVKPTMTRNDAIQWVSNYNLLGVAMKKRAVKKIKTVWKVAAPFDINDHRFEEMDKKLKEQVASMGFEILSQPDAYEEKMQRLSRKRTAYIIKKSKEAVRLHQRRQRLFGKTGLRWEELNFETVKDAEFALKGVLASDEFDAIVAQANALTVDGMPEAPAGEEMVDDEAEFSAINEFLSKRSPSNKRRITDAT